MIDWKDISKAKIQNVYFETYDAIEEDYKDESRSYLIEHEKKELENISKNRSHELRVLVGQYFGSITNFVG
ncbi:hypothetical protein [Anaerobium acetethylicum]|uniref:Uncharacterized protein n=1 Tax=Anaerobium acetethylicum TaxID=1619234 RepID=A0A1D3TXN7_9FIRM|nr:hypothetical protein [Anaerobium acetethylicum]SCP99122.1 hypothetical protein SAMN05421730_10331 [Anaerobium acetethylicum]